MQVKNKAPLEVPSTVVVAKSPIVTPYIFTAWLGPKPRDHRLRELDAMHAHAALHEGKSDTARLDPHQRSPVPGEVDDHIDDWVNDRWIEHLR